MTRRVRPIQEYSNITATLGDSPLLQQTYDISASWDDFVFQHNDWEDIITSFRSA